MYWSPDHDASFNGSTVCYDELHFNRHSCFAGKVVCVLFQLNTDGKGDTVKDTAGPG